MLALQFAIGAANDWADAVDDAVTRPAKPIASGLVRRGQAATVALVCAAAALALAAAAGRAPRQTGDAPAPARGPLFLVAGAAGSLVLEGAGAPLVGAWFYGMAA